MIVQNSGNMSRIKGWIWLSTPCITEIFVNPSLMYITTIHIDFIRTHIAVLVWEVWKMSIFSLFFPCLSACIFACSGLLVIMIRIRWLSTTETKKKKQHIRLIYNTTVLVVSLQEFLFLRFEVIIWFTPRVT